MAAPKITPQKRSAHERAVEQLASNRAAAQKAAQQLGGRKLAQALRKAQARLDARLKLINPGADFTLAAQRQTLEQLRAVVYGVKVKGKTVIPGLLDDAQSAVREASHEAAQRGAEAPLKYIVDAEKRFRGISSLGPRFEDAVQLDTSVAGADATVLRRVATDPGYRGSAAQAGVMERYGVAVVSQFETVMQQMMLTNTPWAEARQELVSSSRWLQDQPLFWAERILRTETTAAYSRATHETMRQSEEQLGETMLRILVATFDDRTSWDSYQVHGMVRRMEEPFVDGMGRVYMDPPNRPNDREDVVPHLLSWPLPPELLPRSDAEVQEAWVRDTATKKNPGGKAGGPPPRPLMSTVEGFGLVPG